MDIISFSRTEFKPLKLLEHIKDKKVFIQANEKYQPLVSEFYDGLLPWESFLEEISKRTGSERPESELFWIPLVEKCAHTKTPVKLIEPDINKVLTAAVKKLKIDPKEVRHVIQDTRLWFISGSGYLKHFASAFNMIFFWLPKKAYFRNKWLGLVGFVVNHIPGDQKDVMALVHITNGILSERIAKRIHKLKNAVVFLDEDISGRVKKMAAEM
ncbi:MAG: hypothetical protein GOV01_03075 [Candidatus Altiarchaeota archaeon]|nr:hypothetical protein [Candidatus Altiarchaeota archaeon]